MAQSVLTAPEVLIASPTLKAVRMFGYLGTTASDNLSRDDELGSCIRKSATTFDQLTRHVWDNWKLALNIKVQVYQTCILSTFLYGGETWTTYSRHERRLDTF